jgi:hypothetical protein
VDSGLLARHIDRAEDTASVSISPKLKNLPAAETATRRQHTCSPVHKNIYLNELVWRLPRVESEGNTAFADLMEKGLAKS